MPGPRKKAKKAPSVHVPGGRLEPQLEERLSSMILAASKRDVSRAKPPVEPLVESELRLETCWIAILAALDAAMLRTKLRETTFWLKSCQGDRVRADRRAIAIFKKVQMAILDADEKEDLDMDTDLSADDRQEEDLVVEEIANLLRSYCISPEADGRSDDLFEKISFIEEDGAVDEKNLAAKLASASCFKAEARVDVKDVDNQIAVKRNRELELEVFQDIADKPYKLISFIWEYIQTIVCNHFTKNARAFGVVVSDEAPDLDFGFLIQSTKLLSLDQVRALERTIFQELDVKVSLSQKPTVEIDSARVEGLMNRLHSTHTLTQIALSPSSIFSFCQRGKHTLFVDNELFLRGLNENDVFYITAPDNSYNNSKNGKPRALGSHDLDVCYVYKAPKKRVDV